MDIYGKQKNDYIFWIIRHPLYLNFKIILHLPKKSIKLSFLKKLQRNMCNNGRYGLCPMTKSNNIHTNEKNRDFFDSTDIYRRSRTLSTNVGTLPHPKTFQKSQKRFKKPVRLYILKLLVVFGIKRGIHCIWSHIL
jgi:hypothetical protein